VLASDRMPFLPESPRKRRRVLRLGALAIVVVAGATTAAAVGGHKPPRGAATVNEGPAQLASNTKTTLTRADRLAIDRALDVFVPAGLERRDMRKAWAVAGPEFRADSSLAGWLRGNTSVPAYPARDRDFHGKWDTIDVEPGAVIFNLALHPRPGAKEPPTVFSGQVVKRGGRWLVNRMYAISLEYKVTRTTHEIGPADFGAGAVYHPPPPDKARYGGIGILPIVGILALVLLIPASLGGVAIVRARRWRRQVRERQTTLPPLPSTYRRT
jgi:hypothetical protein